MLITCGICSGQNLVPNFSFEQYDSCPNFADELERCINWNKFSATISTPDYYNACTPSFMNVPNSFNGYQQDHRNCGAYVGLVTYGPTPVNYREQIGIELSQTLIIGQKYFLSFYTVMAEVIYPNGYHYAMPSNGIGLRLSTVAYDGNNPCPIDNFAHLYSTAVINDSINWTRITSSVVADSAYNYIIIGNFLDDMTIDTMHYTCDSCLNYLSYYYVDDVCLSTDSLFCNGGIDLIPCNVGINEIKSPPFNVYPNPLNDKLNISTNNNGLSEIILYDMSLRILLRHEFMNSITLNIGQLAKGVYLYQVRNKNGVIKKGKVVKD